MTVEMLRNFCIEPSLLGCCCAIDLRCGGIVETDSRCPEHGAFVQLEDIIETHFHPVQRARRAVGTANGVRYDDASAKHNPPLRS